MSQDTWRRDEPESPCIKICVVHPQARLCTGCYRTLDEIAGWGQMSPEARREIMAELPARGPLVTSRRGGRAGRTAGTGA